MTITDSACTWRPTTSRPRIAAILRPYVDRVLAAGFDVHVPAGDHVREAGHVYVTKPGLPGCALIQDPAFSLLMQRVLVTVPVHPSRQYGSAVLVDFDETAEELPAVLAKVLASPTVTTRFVEPRQTVPVDVRIPHDAVLMTGGTRSRVL